MLDDLFSRTEQRMQQSVESVKRDLNALRTGRASLAILDGVMVDYYGQSTPLNQTCKLAIPEPSLILAQPFDPTTLPAIEKAIQGADLGLNPSNDGKVIRIPIPPLTEERRKQLVKKVKQVAEEGRNAVRQIRRDANEELKILEKDDDSGVSEDDAHRGRDKVQKITDEHVARIDELAKKKESELLEF